jgi:thiamine-phosphate pyrophosphorylase
MTLPASDGTSGRVPRKVEPRLIAITDRTLASATETLARYERLARAARPWSILFQLRDHELAARERLDFGLSLRALCTAEEQWLGVNDRLDLALLLGADAVHLGERSVSAADARALVGSEVFVSRACHDPECKLDPEVDAWVLSPIFAERKGRAALGVGSVWRLAERCRGASRHGSTVEVFALGGVTSRNAEASRAAGATGVAVIGAVLVSGEDEELVEALQIRR